MAPHESSDSSSHYLADAQTKVNSQAQKQARPPVAGRGGQQFMLDLLTYAAADEAWTPGNPVESRLLEGISDRQLQYVMEAGLAPLLYRAVRNSIDRLPAEVRDTLLSADLTAQVRHGNLADTANDVIDVCQGMKVPVTLLKGISISEQLYPLPHLRPMGDIDILVPEDAGDTVESALRRHGYSPLAGHVIDEESYHRVPLLHPERGVWVEVHTGLFPERASLRRNQVFSPSHVATQSVVSMFHGRPVGHLSCELQLVYVASSWIRDLSSNESDPSFVPPLLDAIYLLKASRQELNWAGLLGWLDNDMAIASLYLMLAYLCRHGLAPSAHPFLPTLASRQSIVGRLEMKTIHAMVDNYLLGGRPFTRLFHSSRIWHTLLTPASGTTKLLSLPWNIVFPPSSPDRYKLRYQLDRIQRLVRRLS
jgi:hypothetical protein